MHVPDGFLDLPTSITTATAAAASIAVALRRLDISSDDRWAVRAGLTAAFVFAAQMVNFPVGAGTSGHLIGAALATMLLGPPSAVIVMTCVLIVQALVFADGGLTALGTNVLLMGVTPVLVTQAVRMLVPSRWADNPRATVLAAGVGAGLGVPTAAVVFCALYLIGGAVPIPAAPLVTTMVSVHLLIGVGEALITAVCLSAIRTARPDLIAPAPDRISRPTLAVLVGIVVAVAGGLSLLASQHPDGLESVATALGFETSAQPSRLASSPLADYQLAALGQWGGSVAGVLGVLLTAGCVWWVARLMRRRAH